MFALTVPIHEMFVRAFIDLILEALYKCAGLQRQSNESRATWLASQSADAFFASQGLVSIQVLGRTLQLNNSWLPILRHCKISGSLPLCFSNSSGDSTSQEARDHRPYPV
jgi:hypothetical protein